MDVLTKRERSELMSKIRGKNTVPEMALRRMVWALGYRYRLHGSTLPGKPDLVFARRRKVIFMHGCFWHYHGKCPKFSMPKSRCEFWVPKLEANRARDKRNQRLLRAAGWKVMVVWECELRKPTMVPRRLLNFLGDVSGTNAQPGGPKAAL